MVLGKYLLNVWISFMEQLTDGKGLLRNLETLLWSAKKKMGTIPPDIFISISVFTKVRITA